MRKRLRRVKRILFGDAIYKLELRPLKNDCGHVDPNKRIMRIDPRLDNDEMLKTFIHELIHLMEIEAGIKIKHADVYRWERAVFKLLKSNGWTY